MNGIRRAGGLPGIFCCTGRRWWSAGWLVGTSRIHLSSSSSSLRFVFFSHTSRCRQSAERTTNFTKRTRRTWYLSLLWAHWSSKCRTLFLTPPSSSYRSTDPAPLESCVVLDDLPTGTKDPKADATDSSRQTATPTRLVLHSFMQSPPLHSSSLSFSCVSSTQRVVDRGCHSKLHYLASA